MDEKQHNQVHVNVHSHFKRLGREFAMQYLYMQELSKAANADEEAAARDNFWIQAENSGIAVDERVFAKARLYAEKLIAGVLENQQEIDEVISSSSERWDISRMPNVDRNIIRIAVYELKHCPDIPVLVSINEAIEIAKDYATERSGNFINGILNGIKDTIQRDESAK